MSIKNYFVFNKKITLFTAKKNKNKHFQKIPPQKFVYKQFNAYLCLVNSTFTQKRTTNCFLTY